MLYILQLKELQKTNADMEERNKILSSKVHNVTSTDRCNLMIDVFLLSTGFSFRQRKLRMNHLSLRLSVECSSELQLKIFFVCDLYLFMFQFVLFLS